MTAFLLRAFAALSVVVATLTSVSCGGGETPTRITILPQNITVAGTPTIIYTAVGHYKNSQTTKDITSQVIWQTSTPSIVAFSDTAHPNYLTPTGSGCGNNLGVTASIYKNSKDPSSGQVVVAPATVNVQCGAGSGIDFGLSSNPTSVTASAGSEAKYTISVVVKSGNPTVDLQIVGGLPPGSIAAFSAPSVTGTAFSTLTISVAAGTAAGTYHPKITGSDASGPLNLTISLIVT